LVQTEGEGLLLDGLEVIHLGNALFGASYRVDGPSDDRHLYEILDEVGTLRNFDELCFLVTVSKLGNQSSLKLILSLDTFVGNRLGGETAFVDRVCIFVN
jgi:hypothetical protein